MFKVLQGLYTRFVVLLVLLTNWFINERVSSKVNLLRMWSGRRHTCTIKVELAYRKHQ